MYRDLIKWKSYRISEIINECGNNKRVQWELIFNAIYNMIKLDSYQCHLPHDQMGTEEIIIFHSDSECINIIVRKIFLTNLTFCGSTPHIIITSIKIVANNRKGWKYQMDSDKSWKDKHYDNRTKSDLHTTTQKTNYWKWQNIQW